MVQCVSDSNPYDDEPDVIEEAEYWLKHHPATEGCESELLHTRMVIENLLGFIKEEI